MKIQDCTTDVKKVVNVFYSLFFSHFKRFCFSNFFTLKTSSKYHTDVGNSNKKCIWKIAENKWHFLLWVS